MDQPGHLPPQICIKPHSSVTLCHSFYLMAFRIKLDASRVSCLVLGNNGQYMSVCAKTVSSWVRKVLSIARACIFLGTLCGFGSCCPPIFHPAER